MNARSAVRASVVATALMAAALQLCQAQAQAQAQATPAMAATPGKPAAKAAAKLAPELEPRAIELLRAMSAKLAAAQSMAFTATVTYEHPSRIGPALAYTTVSEVMMQRPDRLRVVTVGDGPGSEFSYDGRTMTAFVIGPCQGAGCRRFQAAIDATDNEPTP